MWTRTKWKLNLEENNYIIHCRWFFPLILYISASYPWFKRFEVGVWLVNKPARASMMADVDDRSRLLLQNKSRIVRELDVIKVLPRLVQKRAFTIAEERQILSKSDNAGRAEALIDLLTQKPAGAFDEFNNCLKTTYPKLRQLLLVSAYGKWPFVYQSRLVEG